MSLNDWYKYLGNNFIGDEGAIALGKALEANTTLIQLSLGI